MCIFYFYFNLFEKQIKARRMAFFGLILYIFLFGILLFYWKENDNLKTDSFLSAYNTLFVILFSLLWFQKIFSNIAIDNLFRSPIFIIISALLIYYTSTLFLFLMSDYMLKDKEYSFIAFWQINVVSIIILRIFFIIGIKNSFKK